MRIRTARLAAMTIAAGHDDPDLVPITRNELRHLITTTLYAALTSTFRIAWSLWRRCHQARARTSARRTAPPEITK